MIRVYGCIERISRRLVETIEEVKSLRNDVEPHTLAEREPLGHACIEREVIMRDTHVAAEASIYREARDARRIIHVSDRILTTAKAAVSEYERTLVRALEVTVRIAR